VIKKRGSRWRVVVQAGRDPLTQRRRQLSGSAATKQEELELERRLMNAVAKRLNPDITLERVVAEFWAAGPRLAPTTKLNYRSNLDLHILPVLGNRKVADIRARLVATFLTHLRGDKQLGGATVRKVRTVLSAVMSYAVAMEYVETNPAMKVPPPELDSQEGEAPTIEEAAALILAAEEHDPDFLTYLWVAAEEGGRRGETLALRWRGVDFATGVLTIDGTISRGADGVKLRDTTKTKKPRRVGVSAITLAYLAEHRARVEDAMCKVVGHPVSVSPDDLVFSGGSGSRRKPLDGKPWRPDSTSRRFRRLKELAGVRSNIDLNGLRHCVDKVRRRTQNETLGHRGHKHDPLYRIRKLLLAGHERLDERGQNRMLLGLRVGDPRDEVLGARLAKESVRDVYLTDDPDDAALLLDKAIAGCADDDVDEIRALGRTLASWRTEILEHHRTGASNGPTEGLNLCVKKVKRCGHGFRTFEHYRLRVLLHAGGVTWPTRPSPPRIRTRTPYSGA
jgi:integrase